MEEVAVPAPSFPPATWVGVVESGMLLNPAQLTVPFLVTVPELQVTVTAEAGISVQLLPVPAMKLAELAATFKFQARALAPAWVLQVTLACTLPVTALPGLLAAKEMELGLAVTRLTVVAHASCAVIRMAAAAVKYRFIQASGLSLRVKLKLTFGKN